MRIRDAILLVSVVTTLAAVPAARADDITLAGSSIPLREVEILAIRGGQVYYTDHARRRRSRTLDEIRTLAFDGFEALDEAERLLAAGEAADGLRALRHALLDAPDDRTRRWVRIRLVKVHGLRREYVEAAGHLAAIYLETDDPAWRDLEPVGEPQPPSPSAAAEAMVLLERADREVRNGVLAASVDRMLERIRPIVAALPDANDPKASEETARTSSGFTTDDRRPSASRERLTRDLQPRTGAEIDLNGPQRIEALLREGRAGEALELCRRIARDPDDRALGQFMYQHGRALEATGRGADAAVQFARVAIHTPDAPERPAALLALARVHLDVFDRVATAGRLAGLARAEAERRGDREVVEAAARLLESIAPENAGP